MNNFIFENATKAYFGKGCVKEYLAKELSAYGSNILLAYGSGSIKRSGIYDEILCILNCCEKNVTEFPGIMPNPTYKKVLEGAALAKKHHIDLILAVGGGSVMDCCKAVSMAAVSTKDIWENYWARPGIIPFDPLPVGAVVTVAGTGSEMNGGAVITNEAVKVKTGRDYPECNPKFAFLDPVYTFSVPTMQVMSGGFDILSHIMETYFSEPDEDNISDDIAEALMRSVIRDLRIVQEEPDNYTARSNLMWASSMGENRIIKLGKKMDFEAHQIEHQLGAYTDCNHGCGLAVISPVYYRHIFCYGLEKFSRFARTVWGISDESMTKEALASAGVEALADFIKELGLPSALREIGIKDQALLGEIAASCAISAGSYKRMTHEEILSILQECY